MKSLVICILILCLRGAFSQGSGVCPRECTCEMAPLRSAPFVMAWMSSWGEDDLPEVHPNDVMNGDDMISQEAANDADVDVDVVGLHSTCSLHHTVNLTQLLASLPSTTMVLTILQAPGCNLTIVEGSELARLNSLKALHLQGYAHINKRQVSGFAPNIIQDVVMHQKLMNIKFNKHFDFQNGLNLALVEDALQPLKSLELLDLQYVRLLESEEAKRLRRYSKEPISSTVLLQLPLNQLINVANRIDSFVLPGYIHDKYNISDNLVNYQEQSTQKSQVSSDDIRGNPENNNVLPLYETISELNKKSGFLYRSKTSYIVPYSKYKSEMQPKLSPFKNLNKLKYLRIAQAKLDKIGSEFLNGLQHLHTLTLEHNKIKVIPQNLFASTPNLRHLSLAYNNVLMVNTNSFSSLSKLLTLDLNHNEISFLGSATFAGLTSLETLRIYENPLTQLLPDTFIALNSTKTIYLGSSYISMDLHENSFRYLTNANDVFLKNVSLMSLQKTLLAGMPNIEHFSIHGKVPEIDYDAFSTTPKLKTLNISHSQLEFLSVDALYGLKQLHLLDLSHNHLSSLSPGTFDHLDNLKEIYVNNNFLSSLPLGIFLPVPAQLIQLHNNPWHCTCDLLQLRPSVTNKVRREGYLECQWNGKLHAECQTSKARFVYDARVAPLCQTPFEFTGSDVYHAALRHLKCSKHHWDPSLKQDTEITEENLPENKSKSFLLDSDVSMQEEDEFGWLPLTAYTPAPVDTEDLLDIAEREGLEEAPDEDEAEASDSSDESTSSQKSMRKVNHGKIPLNDDPLHKFLIPKYRSIKDYKSYKEEKAKIKAMMREKEKRRKEEKMLQLKRLLQKEKSKHHKKHPKHIIKKKQMSAWIPKKFDSHNLKRNFMI